MRKLGLIGGMSWESTLIYYRLLNEGVQAKCGGLHSAPCIVYSLEFSTIVALQQQGQWDKAADILSAAAIQLESIGAEGLILCTNTMHKLAPAVQNSVKIPLLHIADATAQSIRNQGVKRILLMGTRYTMEDPFYAEYMQSQFDIKVEVPEKSARDFIHATIYDELCKGIVRSESRDRFQEILADMRTRGIEGAILGCTEIGLLLKPEHSELPLFDSTSLHAAYATDWILS